MKKDSKIYAKEFGKILKAKRSKENISQEALALESGLDRTFISLLERGLSQTSLATIFSLAEILKVPASSIIKEVEKSLKA